MSNFIPVLKPSVILRTLFGMDNTVRVSLSID